MLDRCAHGLLTSYWCADCAMEPTYGYRTTEGVFTTRDGWLQGILDGTNKPKPPEYLLLRKETDGRPRSVMYAIWHRNYKPGRQYPIWLNATDEDFRLAGYL